MITIFKIFENIEYNEHYDKNGNLITITSNGDIIRINKPNVNNYSDDFWNFIRVVDWNKIIKTKDEFENKDKEEELKLKIRVFKNFEYNTLMNFKNEYDKLIEELYLYFKPTWLDNKYSAFMPSDDGYLDLISSIIGKGEFFINRCINYHKLFIDMAKNNKYVENFGYIFQTSWKEYDEINTKYYPLYRDSKKFNM